ncbi:hypothetical protein ABZ023_05300 [Streptomyces sp. NPDC006367]|uniref:Rv1733c family protein n=1 Tax=unclassified Streptomyces TaxID=2593676 RepID=UPI0033BB73A5
MAGETPQAQRPPDRAPRRHPHLLLWRWRSNALRRRTDRAQAWVSCGLLLTVLLAAPTVLVMVGDSAYRHYRQTAAHQERTRDHVPAVLVHDAPRHPEPGSEEARRTRYPAEVRFTGPDGTPRTGKAEVEPGLSAGSTVLVWVDRTGAITGPPLGAEEIRSRSLGWAILAFLGVVLAGLAAHAVTALVLHRRNLAAWDRAWAATSPRWSGFP